MPWLQLPRQEQARQHVKVAASRRLRHAHRARGLGRVPDSAVVVGHHGPEAEERGRRNGDAQLGHVALDVGVDELQAPLQARRFRRRQERARKAAAPPQGRHPGFANLLWREPPNEQRLEPARQRFGRLAQQSGTGAAQHEEPRAQRAAVGQHAEHGRRFWPALNLVDHHQAAQRLEGGHGLGEPGDVAGMLQVEVVHRVGRHQGTGQRRLARLPGTDEGHHPAARERATHVVQETRPGDHRITIP